MRLVEMFEKQVEEEREKYAVSLRNEQRRMHTNFEKRTSLVLFGS